ncbi:MAG: hypothetical protein ACMUIM_06135 [bacterium]
MADNKIDLLENLGFVAHRPIRYWINFDEKKIFREDILDLDEKTLKQMISMKSEKDEWLLFTAQKTIKMNDMDIKLIFGL